MKLLLLLTGIAFLTAGLAAQSPPSQASSIPLGQGFVASNLQQREALVPSDPLGTRAQGGPQAPGADDICYRIRAYIFQRDDDHAPKLVGSTTCGPLQPHTRDATWPPAHFESLK
jgi:hypothetical protein